MSSSAVRALRPRPAGECTMPYVIGILIGLAVGAGGLLAFLQYAAKNVLKQARTEADQIRHNAAQEAQNRAKEIELAARQEQLRAKEQFEREHEKERNELKVQEQ